MNTLTKNRIIEKGDEFRNKDGTWQPVPDKAVGLQIMFTPYTEVRRPSEAPFKKEVLAQSDNGNVTLAPPDAEVAKRVAFVKRVAAGEPMPHENSHLPTVISPKAHTRKPHLALPRAIVLDMADVKYTDLSAIPNWIGRNGTYKAIGLNLYRTKSDVIQLRPIGKRGVARNALIEFPAADIPKIMEWLEEQNRK
jgi:hypothetical protein